MQKSDLRKKYNQLRKDLIPYDIEKLSNEIFHNSKLLDIWDKDNFHVFLSIKNKKEIDTSLWVNHLWYKGKKLSISKSNFENYTLENFVYTPDTKLKINNWGIPEPKNAETINDKEIDVVFVPLLAFDNRGYRVGYGKGFYERFLENCRPDIIKIGVSFFESEDIIDDVHEADIKLDYCITPLKTYNFNDK